MFWTGEARPALDSPPSMARLADMLGVTSATLLAAAVWVVSCTVLVDVPPQCETSADCADRGFAGAACENQVCVSAEAGGGGSGAGGPWDCLGNVEYPPIESPTLTVYARFVDGNGNPVNGGLRVRVCNQLMLTCDSPIADNLTPDEDGIITYEISGDAQGSYLEVQGPELDCCEGGGDDCCTTNEYIAQVFQGAGGGGGAGGAGGGSSEILDIACCGQQVVPSLLFEGRFTDPPPGPYDVPPLTVVTRSEAAAAVFASGFEYQEETAAIALVLTIDCNGEGAAGVRILPEDPSSTPFYFDGLFPDPDLDGTLDGGNSGILNVPAVDGQGNPAPAQSRVTGQLVDGDVYVGVANFLVRPGWFTNVALAPSN